MARLNLDARTVDRFLTNTIDQLFIAASVSSGSDAQVCVVWIQTRQRIHFENEGLIPII